MTATLDVLMITYNRPAYTRLSLERLLDVADEHTRIWAWHNGDDAHTLDVVHTFAGHPRLHTIEHSRDNVKLRAPTNWFWRHADGAMLGKVDDDCLVPPDWIDSLRSAHAQVARLGVLSAWPFRIEDFDERHARRKVRRFAGGIEIMRNAWTGGSGYIMKRQCVDHNGPLRSTESFSQWCIRLALRGWTNGWHYPLLYMEHMDDPRSPYTELRCENDFQRRPPLNASRKGVPSLDETRRRATHQAHYLQQCLPEPWWYVGPGNVLRRSVTRLHSMLRPGAVWTG